MYIDFGIENNDKDSKFKVGDHTRISKYKNIFAKLYIPNLSDQVFQIKKVKNTIPQMYVISDLNGKRFTCTFMDLKQFTKKKKKKRFAKKKVNKLYVKWKGYNNYINSWINKKDIIQNADLKQSKFELDLSNYARKSNFKSATGVDTLKFAKQVDLANLKLDIDELGSENQKLLLLIQVS